MTHRDSTQYATACTEMLAPDVTLSRICTTTIARIVGATSAMPHSARRAEDRDDARLSASDRLPTPAIVADRHGAVVHSRPTRSLLRCD
ncbi:hypothetical protein GCM10009725_19130 [Aeromicrobium tamlense]